MVLQGVCDRAGYEPGVLSLNLVISANHAGTWVRMESALGAGVGGHDPRTRDHPWRATRN